MSITDPPLPNIINAVALYTNYNTFKRKIYEHESKNVLDESYKCSQDPTIIWQRMMEIFLQVHTLTIKPADFFLQNQKNQKSNTSGHFATSCIKTMIQLFDRFEVLIPKCLHLSNS